MLSYVLLSLAAGFTLLAIVALSRRERRLAKVFAIVATGLGASTFLLPFVI
jgi:hypothetical protein